MSRRRVATAFSMMAREFLRRRGTLGLIIAVPLVSYVAVYAALPEAPASVEGVENGVTVWVDIDQRDLFGVFQGLGGVAFVAGLTGLNLMQGGLKADRRLILAGYSAAELMIARLLLLLLIDVPVTVYMVGVMLFFTTPRQLPAFTLAFFWAAWIYSFYGALTGVLLRSELGGILVMLFLPNIDASYLQLPGFSNVLDQWYAVLLPAYFPAKLAVDAAFTTQLEQLAPSFWSIAAGLSVAGVMLVAYARATHIHQFMPEQPRRRALGTAIAGAAAIVLAFGALQLYRYYQSQPATVEADGRVSAPEGRVVSLLSGRVRELRIALGDDVVQDQIVAWVEDPLNQITLPMRSPVAGRVTSLPVGRGENVVVGTTMARVHELDKLEAVLEVEETAVGKVMVGQSVELRLSSLDETFAGQVKEIAHEPLPPDVGVSERARRVRKYAVKVTLPHFVSRLPLDMAIRGKIFL